MCICVCIYVSVSVHVYISVSVHVYVHPPTHTHRVSHHGSYKQALEAVNIGRAKLAAFGMPIDRPDDYFAEMVKSDEHMKRVRGRFCLSQKSRSAHKGGVWSVLSVTESLCLLPDKCNRWAAFVFVFAFILPYTIVNFYHGNLTSSLTSASQCRSLLVWTIYGHNSDNSFSVQIKVK